MNPASAIPTVHHTPARAPRASACETISARSGPGTMASTRTAGRKSASTDVSSMASRVHVEVDRARPRLRAVLLGHTDPVGGAGAGPRCVGHVDRYLAREVTRGQAAHERAEI